MVTLFVALILAFVFGRSWEGTIRINGLLSSLTLARLGRVNVLAWSHRPGRAYVRLAVS